MLALWIVLAVVVATLVVGLVVVVPRRRRARRAAPRPSGDRHRRRPPTEAPRRRRRPLDAAPAEAPAPAAGAGPRPPDAERRGPRPSRGRRPRAPRAAWARPAGCFSGYVRALRSRSSVDDETWDDLEEALLRADVGVATTTALLDDLRARVRRRRAARRRRRGRRALREDLRRSLDDRPARHRALGFEDGDGTQRLALRRRERRRARRPPSARSPGARRPPGRSVLLAAGDTFRAAAAEQLDLWAERTGVEIVRGAEGGDPARSSSTPCSGPRRGATTSSWPTPPAGCTPRSTWSRS